MWLLTKNIVFTLLVPGTVAGYLPWLLVRGAPQPPALYLMMGSILMVTGISGYLWCLWDFAWHGKGTPAPIDAPGILVIRGLYRFLRNPMYVSVLLVIFGWSLTYLACWVLCYGCLVGALFHLFVVFYEEPHLAMLFGHSYQNYCATTKRWIPFLSKN